MKSLFISLIFLFGCSRPDVANLEEKPKNAASATVDVVEDTTPLHEACLSGRIDVVRSLIANRVNLNAKNCYDATPLGYAVLRKHYAIAELLLKNGASPHGIVTTNTVYHRSALAEAIFQNNRKMIALLKKYGADINHKDEDGNTDMHRISHIGSDDVEKLLTAGADVNAKNFFGATAFFYLPSSFQVGVSEIGKIVEILKKYGANINEFHEGTPLTVATYNHDTDKTEILLQNGANPELGWGTTSIPPLNIAAKTGNLEMVMLLIKYGASIETSDTWGITPLLSAASCGEYQPVPFSYVHFKDEYLKIVQLLIDRGAKVNVTEKYGNTPLLCAVRANYKEMVELLLKNGAKIDVMNQAKETPLSIAQKQKNKEIQKILENALQLQKLAL